MRHGGCVAAESESRHRQQPGCLAADSVERDKNAVALAPAPSRALDFRFRNTLARSGLLIASVCGCCRSALRARISPAVGAGQLLPASGGVFSCRFFAAFGLCLLPLVLPTKTFVDSYEVLRILSSA
jgi:hypothetical protein